MKIISEAEFREWLRTNLGVGSTRKDVEQEYVKCAVYRLPNDTGRKTAIGRLVSRSVDTSKCGLFWITAWSIFPSTENMAIFDGYRRSLGESRPIHAAPAHVFGASDLPHLECLFDLALYFFWDASLFDEQGTVVVRISHDEHISIRSKDDSLAQKLQDNLELLTG